MQVDAKTLRGLLLAAPPSMTLRLEWCGTAAELAKLLAGGDPEERTLTTRDAARTFGWLPRDWARWCAEGLVEGAVEEPRGWRMPYLSCKAVRDRKMKVGGRGEPEPAGEQRPATTQQKRGGNHGRFRSLAEPEATLPPSTRARRPAVSRPLRLVEG